MPYETTHTRQPSYNMEKKNYLKPAFERKKAVTCSEGHDFSVQFSAVG